ncbi:hypothetical protein FKX85_16630 [Echinicola soli]|uniref:RHS repeat-associated core domain-containing protein n=1 Tax=Echinicola soli TaxID=2591634 RepID=A0A514CLE6_9BACT|nr:RHS repeat-associated core domain-containing protein [Echinicola soli]QDH80577.1 hypothetical protein FKX85_16630 [Echinicola soli]
MKSMDWPSHWRACPVAYFGMKPGDKVSAEVWAKYLDPETKGASGSSFAQLIEDLSNNASHIVLDGATAGTDPVIPFAGMISHGSGQAGAPKAYLNLLVLDRNQNYVSSSFVQVSTSAKENGSDIPHEYRKINPVTIKEPGYVYIYLSNETGSRIEVFPDSHTGQAFDDFKVTHTHSPIVQKDDYYPFGMSFNSYSRPGATSQKYLYNKGSELIDDLNLGLYWTPNRFYDPAIGRFLGTDKLSDMYTSISPMVFGFNNPIKFNDPTGLLGECDDCPEVDLPEVTVTASRLQEANPDYSLLFEQFRNSTNTVYRNLGYVAQNKGAKEARDLLTRGRPLHYSDFEA